MWLAISAIRGVMGWSSAAVASHVAQSVPIPDEPSLVLPHVLGDEAPAQRHPSPGAHDCAA